MRKPLVLSALIVVSLIALLTISACKPSSKKTNNTSPAVSNQETVSNTRTTRIKYLSEQAEAELRTAGIDLNLFRNGRRYYELYCTACHQIEIGSTAPAPTNMLAPPAFAVANHYQLNFENLNKRVAAIEAFVSDPSEEKGIMPGAARRFGTMIKINLPEDQIHAIALFLASAEFKEPLWYRSHYLQQHGNSPLTVIQDPAF